MSRFVVEIGVTVGGVGRPVPLPQGLGDLLGRRGRRVGTHVGTSGRHGSGRDRRRWHEQTPQTTEGVGVGRPERTEGR